METNEMTLDEMRNQIAILRQKLDKEEIVNDRLLRDAMKQKARSIDYTKRRAVQGAILAIVLWIGCAWAGLFSVPLSIVTCLSMVFSIWKTYRIHRPVERMDIMTDDLKTVASVMSTFKKEYDNWIKYYTPTFTIIWVPWACYDYGIRNAPEGVNPFWFALPLLVGAVIGGFIGYRYHKKAVNAAKSIIEQIESA